MWWLIVPWGLTLGSATKLVSFVVLSNSTSLSLSFTHYLIKHLTNCRYCFIINTIISLWAILRILKHANTHTVLHWISWIAHMNTLSTDPVKIHEPLRLANFPPFYKQRTRDPERECGRPIWAIQSDSQLCAIFHQLWELFQQTLWSSKALCQS